MIEKLLYENERIWELIFPFHFLSFNKVETPSYLTSNNFLNIFRVKLLNPQNLKIS